MLPGRAPSSPEPYLIHQMTSASSTHAVSRVLRPCRCHSHPWYLPGISLVSPWFSLVSPSYLPGPPLPFPRRCCFVQGRPWSWPWLSPWFSLVSPSYLLRSEQAVVLAVAVVVATAVGVHVIMHDCLRVMDRTVAVSTAGHASAFVIMKHQRPPSPSTSRLPLSVSMRPRSWRSLSSIICDKSTPS